MSVRIVADSVADLPPEVVEELGITVIPLIIHFGTETYQDGVDLTADQFYEKLQTSRFFPTTSMPAPPTFAKVYDRLAKEADGILVITLSSRFSVLHDVALKSIELMQRQCRVEVLDSEWATTAEGFIVMAAAEAAKAGASLDQVIEATRKTIPRVDFLAAFDTLEYLRRGGRIGKAQAFMGSMLKINPLVTLREGVVEPAGRTRSRAKAIDRLYDFAAGYARIERMAVEDTACPEDAEALLKRLGAIYPRERIYRSRMTPAIGTHTGPGLLLVSVLGDKK